MPMPEPPESADPAANDGSAKSWLAVAAHELRGPLGSIQGIAEFLHEGAGGDLTPTQQQLVATIYDTSSAVLKMVGEILDIAAEEGESSVTLSPCDLTQLVKRRVAIMNVHAAAKRTQIRFQGGAEASWPAINPEKVEQVVDNLLSNAVKYSPPGATVTVGLRCETESETVAVCVRDQGPGIPLAEQHKLFTCFGRLSTRPTGGEKSIGLGLAICRKIAEAHHGRIEFENVAAGGCEFRLVLPLPADRGSPDPEWTSHPRTQPAPGIAA